MAKPKVFTPTAQDQPGAVAAIAQVLGLAFPHPSLPRRAGDRPSSFWDGWEYSPRWRAAPPSVVRRRSLYFSN